jgi:hypothetical protein
MAAQQLREIGEDLQSLDLPPDRADPANFEEQLEPVLDVSVAAQTAYGEDAVDGVSDEITASYNRFAERGELAEGSGELYGVVPARANDIDLPDGDRSFDQGENWIEALQQSAVENGAEAEQDIAIVDDENGNAPVKTSHDDTPIADLGSGGRAGM